LLILLASTNVRKLLATVQEQPSRIDSRACLTIEPIQRQNNGTCLIPVSRYSKRRLLFPYSFSIARGYPFNATRTQANEHQRVFRFKHALKFPSQSFKLNRA